MSPQKIDPNLMKIANFHMYRIKRGKLARPIAEAKDYLEYLLGYDLEQINKELDVFIDFMQSLEINADKSEAAKHQRKRMAKKRQRDNQGQSLLNNEVIL